MNNKKEREIDFDIRIDECRKGQWGFGVCLYHKEEETYFCINFFKWSVNIGLMYIDDDWEDWIDSYWD